MTDERPPQPQHVTDQGMRHLVRVPALINIILVVPGLTDDGLRILEAKKNLKELTLVRTQVTPAGVERLKRAIPGLIVSVPTGPTSFD